MHLIWYTHSHHLTPQYLYYLENNILTLQLKNAEMNEVDLPYYDPVWYKTNNRQTVATDNMKNADTKAPISYDSTWYNSSIERATAAKSGSLSQAQVTSTESKTLKETKDSCHQAQATSSLISNKKSITTFTYRVLKVGTLDYTTKRAFSISKDGIQFWAHHLSEGKINFESLQTFRHDA